MALWGEASFETAAPRDLIPTETPNNFEWRQTSNELAKERRASQDVFAWMTSSRPRPAPQSCCQATSSFAKGGSRPTARRTVPLWLRLPLPASENLRLWQSTKWSKLLLYDNDPFGVPSFTLDLMEHEILQRGQHQDPGHMAVGTARRATG